MLAKDEAFLADLQRKRGLVADRLAKSNPRTKEYEWEKEQLDDLDKGIERLRISQLRYQLSNPWPNPTANESLVG